MNSSVEITTASKQEIPSIAETEAELAKVKVMPFQVTAWSARYGERSLKAANEEDAVELGRNLAAFLRARLGDTDKRDNYFDNDWSVVVESHVVAKYGMDEWEDWRNHPVSSLGGFNQRRRVWGATNGAQRLAHPLARVFAIVEGKSGYEPRYWGWALEAPDFLTMHNMVEKLSYEVADGPTTVRSCSKIEFETYRIMGD